MMTVYLTIRDISSCPRSLAYRFLIHSVESRTHEVAFVIENSSIYRTPAKIKEVTRLRVTLSEALFGGDRLGEDLSNPDGAFVLLNVSLHSRKSFAVIPNFNIATWRPLFSCCCFQIVEEVLYSG